MLKLLRKRSKAILSGLTFSVLIILLQLTTQPTLQSILKRVDGLLYDIRLSQTMEYREFDDISVIIVDLDEKSLEAEGRWPWSRNKIVTLIEKLTDAGTVVIAFDVLFSEPERNPVDIVTARISDPAIANQVAAFRTELDADTNMAESLQQNDIVLGILFHEDTSLGDIPVESYIETDQADIAALTIEKYSGFNANVPVLQANTPGSGFINSSPDEDGFIRRAKLLINYQDQIFPSLALEAARLYALAEKIEVRTNAQGNDNFAIEGVVVGNTLVPTDGGGRVLVPYKGEQKSFPYVSATDVLNDRIDPFLFDSSVVFVGTSAVGLADLRATPVGLQYPGVEVHANVFEGLIHPDVLNYRPDWWWGGTALFLALLGIFLSVTLPVLSPIKMAIMGGFTLVATIAGNFYLWSEAHLSLPLATSILLILILTIYNFTDGFFSEANQKKFIKSIFDQYVPPAHIDEMIEDPSALNLDGQRKKMSVLFSDIRSFTTISEKLTAQELKELLNRYFNPITKSIFEHDGTIDKYVGDMVMAFWGAPLDDPKHAENSIRCAFDMLDITHQLREEFAADGLPEVNIGVGINTGIMNVGDMGSEYRRAYTVLGDAVNLGSRLEGLTKYYGVELLVSEFTVAACPDMHFRLMDKVRVKGKDKAVAIYEPIRDEDWVEQTIAELEQYQTAYQQYLEQNWQAAEQQFSALQQLSPNRKVYSIYVERIAELKELPKQENWDGSYTHTSK